MSRPDVELPLRDQLAYDRTVLANRRTWLAYFRTGMALFVAGMSFLQVFEAVWTHVIGVVFMASAGPMIYGGYLRFRRDAAELEALIARQLDLIAAEKYGTRPPA